MNLLTRLYIHVPTCTYSVTDHVHVHVHTLDTPCLYNNYHSVISMQLQYYSTILTLEWHTLASPDEDSNPSQRWWQCRQPAGWDPAHLPSYWGWTQSRGSLEHWKVSAAPLCRPLWWNRLDGDTCNLREGGVLVTTTLLKHLPCMITLLL